RGVAAGVRRVLQQDLGVRAGDGFVVDVDDTTLTGGGVVGDLVDVTGGRQARSDVDELSDAALDGVTHGSSEEGPVQPGTVTHVRSDLQLLLGECPVDGVVVGSAEQIVVYPTGGGLVQRDVESFVVVFRHTASPRRIVIMLGRCEACETARELGVCRVSYREPVN